MSCGSCSCYSQKQGNNVVSAKMSSNRPLNMRSTQPMLFANVIPTFGGSGYNVKNNF